MPGKFRVLSPVPPRGAIAIVEVRADIDALLPLCFPSRATLSIGAVSVRTIPGVDRMVLARPTPDTLLLFPHASPAVLARLIQYLSDPPLSLRHDSSPADEAPNAAESLESRMLAALTTAASPLAIDLLLDQPRRWCEQPDNPIPDDEARPLRHLLTPPLIAAIGPPNIGKSSLLNALAGRAVAIVADQPGTTRDHVGVLLDLAGLTVRWIDCPGITNPPPTDPIQSASQSSALAAAHHAALILLCRDSTSGFPTTDPPIARIPTIKVSLRADLGLPPPTAWSGLAVSARQSHSIPPLVSALRDVLLPPSLLSDSRPWTFWNMMNQV